MHRLLTASTGQCGFKGPTPMPHCPTLPPFIVPRPHPSRPPCPRPGRGGHRPSLAVPPGGRRRRRRIHRVGRPPHRPRRETAGRAPGLFRVFLFERVCLRACVSVHMRSCMLFYVWVCLTWTFIRSSIPLLIPFNLSSPF